MARALKLAQRGRFTTHLNPNVGCVIVNNGDNVGEGYHHRAESRTPRFMRCDGGRKSQRRKLPMRHAFEPCSHHGERRHSCDALIAAGARVVAAMVTRTHRSPGADCIVCNRRVLRSATG